jgi:hypothetical protein
VDLLFENLGALGLLLLTQYLSQTDKLGIHWFAVCALLCHDVALHSVNPHSSSYFNPVFDYVLKPNICHQLHHACCHAGNENGDEGYILFTAFRHLDAKKRKADTEKYNKIFKTSFCF